MNNCSGEGKDLEEIKIHLVVCQVYEILKGVLEQPQYYSVSPINGLGFGLVQLHALKGFQ